MTAASAQLFTNVPGAQAPQSRAELEALIARRDELKEQLSSLNDRRGELADQVERLGSGSETRAAPLARLRETDARIGRIEADLARADELIAAGKARGLESEGREGDGHVDTRIVVDERTPMPQVFTHVDEGSWPERAMQQLDTTLPITLGTVLLLGALLYWRISASMKRQFAQMIASQAGRFEELQRSVDTVAVEMERVSENQRFVTKLVGDKQPSAVERR